jgi:hypothetical protein
VEVKEILNGSAYLVEKLAGDGDTKKIKIKLHLNTAHAPGTG